MTVSRLCDGAELFVQVMHVTSEEEVVIRSTIHNYALPEACGKQICWMIYRVVQAIKSLFGASDWQATKKVISDRWVSTLVQESILPQNERERFANFFYYSRATEEMLKLMILIQQDHAVDSPALREVAGKWDLVDRMRTRFLGYTVTEPED